MVDCLLRNDDVICPMQLAGADSTPGITTETVNMILSTLGTLNMHSTATADVLGDVSTDRPTISGLWVFLIGNTWKM
jgi:hypothetical protein